MENFNSDGISCVGLVIDYNHSGTPSITTTPVKNIAIRKDNDSSKIPSNFPEPYSEKNENVYSQFVNNNNPAGKGSNLQNRSSTAVPTLVNSDKIGRNTPPSSNTQSLAPSKNDKSIHYRTLNSRFEEISKERRNGAAGNKMSDRSRNENKNYGYSSMPIRNTPQMRYESAYKASGNINAPLKRNETKDSRCSSVVNRNPTRQALLSQQSNIRENNKQKLINSFKQCTDCRVKFGGFLEAIDHFRTKHRNQQQCPACFDRFTAGETFQRHLTENHFLKISNGTVDENISCRLCAERHDYKLMGAHVLNEHLRPLFKNSPDASASSKTWTVNPSKSSTAAATPENIINPIKTSRESAAGSEQELVIGRIKQHFTDEQLAFLIPIFLTDPNPPWVVRAKEAAAVLQIEHVRISMWFSNTGKRFRKGDFPKWSQINGVPMYTADLSDGKLKIERRTTSTCEEEKYSQLLQKASTNMQVKRQHCGEGSGSPEKKKCLGRTNVKFEDSKRTVKAVNLKESSNVQEKIKSLEDEVQICKSAIITCFISNSVHKVTEPVNNQALEKPPIQFEKVEDVQRQQSGNDSTEYVNKTGDCQPLSTSTINAFQPGPSLDISSHFTRNNKESHRLETEFRREKRPAYPANYSKERPYKRENYYEQRHLGKVGKGNFRKPYRQRNRKARKNNKYYWSAQERSVSDRKNRGFKRNQSQTSYEKIKECKEFDKYPHVSNANKRENEHTAKDGCGVKSMNNATDIPQSSHLSHKSQIQVTPKSQPGVDNKISHPSWPSTSRASAERNNTPGSSNEMGQDFKTRQAEIIILSSGNLKKMFAESNLHFKKLQNYFQSREEPKQMAVIQQTQRLAYLVKNQTAFTNGQRRIIDECLDGEGYPNEYVKKQNFKNDIARHWAPIFVYSKHFKRPVDKALKDFINAVKYMKIHIKKFPDLDVVKEIFKSLDY